MSHDKRYGATALGKGWMFITAFLGLLVMTVMFLVSLGNERHPVLSESVSCTFAVDADGSARVVSTVEVPAETSEIAIPGSCAGRDLSIEMSEVAVVAGGGKAVPMPAGKADGMCQAADTDAGTVVTFNTPSHEPCSYRLTYTVSGAVSRNSDSAEAYIPLWCSSFDGSAGRVQARIFLPSPEGEDGSGITAWLHGSDAGLRTGPKGVAADMSDAYGDVYVHLTFPEEWLSGMEQSNVARYDAMRTEEDRYAAGEESKAATSDLAGWALFMVPALLTAFASYERKERDAGWQTSDESYAGGDYLREVPDAPPAILGALWNAGRCSAPDLVATLMDLTRRHVVVYAIDQDGDLMLAADQGACRALTSEVERAAIRFAFIDVPHASDNGTSGYVCLSDIARAADGPLFARAYRKFAKAQSDEFWNSGLVCPPRMHRRGGINAACLVSGAAIPFAAMPMCGSSPASLISPMANVAALALVTALAVALLRPRSIGRGFGADAVSGWAKALVAIGVCLVIGLSYAGVLPVPTPVPSLREPLAWGAMAASYVSGAAGVYYAVCDCYELPLTSYGEETLQSLIVTRDFLCGVSPIPGAMPLGADAWARMFAASEYLGVTNQALARTSRLWDDAGRAVDALVWLGLDGRFRRDAMSPRQTVESSIERCGESHSVFDFLDVGA